MHPKAKRFHGDPDVDIVDGVCPHDCPDTCAWQVAVRRSSGRAEDLWGHPDHAMTDGSLCTKVDRYLDRVYHPDRLAQPLRRTGPKGSGQFEAISWGEAIDWAAAKLRGVIERHGAQSVLPYSYAGTMGLLQGEGVAEPFFHRLGSSLLARTICAEAGSVGYRYTIGAGYGMDPMDLQSSRTILIWGSNALTSNLHQWKVIQRARKSGARVIVIDPVRTRTAVAADEWLGIRPGTDGALALGLMHVIIRDGLHDDDYVTRHCVGFAELREAVEPWTPTRTAQITGVQAQRIEALANEYATARPASIRLNYGMQRHAGGGMATRNIACLPALVGAWREVGGGIVLSTSGAFPLQRREIQRADLREGSAREINMNRLGDALSLDRERLARAHHRPRPNDVRVTPDQAGPFVHALIVYNSNPAAVAPDQGSVNEGLAREDLFTIVLEQFQTDTADHADLVLPATTQFEHWDILKPYGHFFLALNRPAIAPVGQALPNSEIFRRLAAAMGFDDPCFSRGDEDTLHALMDAQEHANLAGITWERLLNDGFARVALPSPYRPFADGGFPTPSGKCELFSQAMVDDGYPGAPTFIPPASLRGAENRGGELQAVTPPAHSFLNSSFVNIDKLRARESKPTIIMHPDDATSRNLHSGQDVQVKSDRGQIQVQLRIDDGLIPGTVAIPSVWWPKLSPQGKGVNHLTSPNSADMGSGALFHDLLVEVTPARP